MQTIGLLPSQQLASLSQDEEGNWLDVPEGQTVVPLVKLPKPTLAEGEKAEPLLVWHADRVERDWLIVAKPAEEIQAERAAKFPDLTPMQVRLALVEEGIFQQVRQFVNGTAEEDATEKLKRQIRYDYATTVKRFDPLVLFLQFKLGWDDATADAKWMEWSKP